MLNFKQKSKAFRELNSPASASTDLQQLRDAGFDTKKCDLYARNPQRYSKDILNHLLDIKKQS
jgi:uroporphyrinogen-III synthase